MAIAHAQQTDRRISVHQHFDERGLAFSCMGFGKAANVPGVFVCTSGTAVANAMPAVIEAAAEDVPMLLLTADRSPELRGTGSNQTIDQVEIFGGFAHAFGDLNCTHEAKDPQKARRTISEFYRQAICRPVHMNCMFAEPFDGTDRPFDIPNDLHQTPIEFHSNDSRQSPSSDAITLHGDKTIVIASGCRREIAIAAKHLAYRLGCPFFADVTSGIRSLAYDLLLYESEAKADWFPETIIHIGRRITSKRLLQFLEHASPESYLHVNETDQPINPVRKVTRTISGNVSQLCQRVQLAEPSPISYLETWETASQRAKDVVQRKLKPTKGDALSEQAVAFHVASELPTPHGLFLGNSMPIRDMDGIGFWGDEKEIHVIANRGASGIDGTIASAVGFAHGLGLPTTAILGDLAALHDLNSFSLLARSKQPVILIILNNDGGGIFHFLPIASQTKHFEQFYGTAHGLTFGDAANMFGVPYTATTSSSEFRVQYLEAVSQDRSSIIEIFTDRNSNPLWYHQILREVQSAIGLESSS